LVPPSIIEGEPIAVLINCDMDSLATFSSTLDELTKVLHHIMPAADSVEVIVSSVDFGATVKDNTTGAGCLAVKTRDKRPILPT
jgi:hypothetical protein